MRIHLNRHPRRCARGDSLPGERWLHRAHGADGGGETVPGGRSTSRATSSQSSRASATSATAPTKARGRLRLDRRAAALTGGATGAAVVPGNSEESLLVRRVLGLDDEERMPKDGDPLPEAQIALIRAWIDQGAAWPGEPGGGGRGGTAQRARALGVPRRPRGHPSRR